MPGRVRKVGFTHVGLKLTAVVLYAINAWLRRDGVTDGLIWLSVISVAALGVSGWLGGEMVDARGVGCMSIGMIALSAALAGTGAAALAQGQGAERQRPSALDRLDRQQKLLAAASARLNERIAAIKPLYASLSAEQKKVADVVLVPGRHGGFGHGHERGRRHGMA